MYQSAYLSVRDCQRLHRHPWHGRTCMRPGCGAPAEYFQIVLSTHWGIRRRRDFCWCARLTREIAEKHGRQVFETCADADAVLRSMREQERREEEDWRERHARQEAERLAWDGMILVLSGMQGQMFRLASGGLAVRIRGSESLEPVCCWHHGARRIGQHLPHPHSPDCPALCPGSAPDSHTAMEA